jgi:hypothetical protein
MADFKDENTTNEHSDNQALRDELNFEKLKNNQILESLGITLFFINPDLTLSDNYSKSVEKVFGSSDLQGKNVVTLLKKHIPEDVVLSTEEFLSFMTRPDLDEELITDMNPLKEIEFFYNDEFGQWVSSVHLSFKFNRIVSDNETLSLVCLVSDISKLIDLTSRVNEAEKLAEKQTEWLVNILHVSPVLMQEFVSVIENGLKNIDEVLKNPVKAGGYDVMLNKIITIARHIHGTSALLDLEFFKNKAEEFKADIEEIKKKKELSGSDFVPVVIQLGAIREMLNEVKTLMQRLKHYRGSLRTTRRYEGSLLVRTIENLIKTLAEQTHKDIKFVYDKFETSAIPFSKQQLVKEFLMTLTRFTILHNIEDTEKRKTANLDPTAYIEIETFVEKRHFGFKYKHNGRLIRIERMLQKAIDMHLLEEEDDEDNIDGSSLGTEVLQLFFIPDSSVSTFEQATDGEDIYKDMQLIRKKLTMHGGRSKVVFTSEENCEYTITIPKK